MDKKLAFMSKKKSKKTGKNASKPSNPLLNIQLTVALLLSVVVFGCFAFLALVERPANNEARLQVISQRLVEAQAVVIDNALDSLVQRLDHFAETPELLAALQADDALAVVSFRRQLQRSFPEAITTRLIELGPLGIAALDTDSLTLRNNIELDLLRRASHAEDVIPEAYRADKQWLFSMAKGVIPEGGKHARAALIISVDVKQLKQLLAKVDGSLGKSQLQQRFAAKSVTLFSHGQGSGGEAVEAQTKVPHWYLLFNPSATLRGSVQLNPNLLWGMLAVIMVLALLLAFYAQRRLKKLLHENLAKLQSGRANTQFSLPDFADFGGHIVARDKEGVPAIVESKDPAPAPAELATESSPSESASPVSEAAGLDTLPSDLPEHIFRAYDIRGIADSELDDETVHAIAMAIGSEALDQGQQRLVVAMDGRISSPRIKRAVIKGLQDSGRDVIDIGMVPTPLMYFATHQLGAQSGVMITGSHNPGKYNGIKIVIAGRALSGEAITALRARVINRQLAEGSGQCEDGDIVDAYVNYIANDIAIAQPLKVVLDAGNGVAGTVAPRLFAELGCEVVPLYCEVDGNFPNHHPDPTVEANLEALKATVVEQEADLGIAFDGDGDRLGVVTASGQSVAADRLLMLLAQDVVSRNPGADILYDVKCTRSLNALISNYGGRPIMWKTGHSYMKDKMAETGALLGGEFSGHIFFKERWFGFDDGLYAGARLIEILSTGDPDLDAQLEAFPVAVGSPELKVASDDEHKFTIIEQLASMGQFGEGNITTLDGVRVDFSDGWGLVRASNTTPMLVLRFEADTEEVMQRIQGLFKEQLLGVDNTLQFSF